MTGAAEAARWADKRAARTNLKDQMPSGDQVKVGRHLERDCWCTWFLRECNDAKLFGAVDKFLRLLRWDYKIGSQLFLEDAPYFDAVGSHHRLSGPYEVVEPTVPEDATVMHVAAGRVVAYRDPHPERGPWFDGFTTRVEDAPASSWRSKIDLRYQQHAGDYEYFPLRFAISPIKGSKVSLVPHGDACRRFYKYLTLED